MKEKDTTNIFDLLLFCLYVLIFFGMVGGGAQPVRLFTVALAPFMIIDAFRRPHEGLSYYRYEIFFLIFWWLFSLGFIFKAIDMGESVKHQVFTLIHMLCFWEVLWAANKACNPQRAICFGWIVMLLFTIPIAVWEFTGGHHLPTTIMENQSISFGNFQIERPYAAITFGNLNTYNTIICWALPFLFTQALFPEKKHDATFALLTFMPLFLVVILNSSRGAIMAMGALILIYIASYLRVGRHKRMMLGGVSVAVFILAYYLYEMFYFIIGRFTQQGMSDDGRAENIVRGIQAWIDSGMLGIGIGNYAPLMGRTYHVLIPAPHNLLLEILVVWGIFAFIGFLTMVYRIYWRAKQGTRRNRYFSYFGLICLLLGGVIDSAYWMKASTWLFIAGLYIMADSRYNKESKKIP